MTGHSIVDCPDYKERPSAVSTAVRGGKGARAPPCSCGIKERPTAALTGAPGGKAPLVKEWLDLEADDPLADLTVADVAEQLGRSTGTIRDWIRVGS